MDRGPMALFGAIVAVGLGPAMWVGAQFGATAVSSRPPAATSEHQPNQSPTQQDGGEAGAAPEDPSVVLENKPRVDYRPLRSTPSPSASASSKKPDPHHSTTDPTEATTSPSPSAGPSTPPTGTTTEPTDPPSGGGGDSDVPPSPPPTDPEPT